MNKPFFEVGEEVILQSKRYPEYSGEFRVERLILPGEVFICRLSGINIKSTSLNVNYLLDIPFRAYLRENFSESECCFAEYSLKKKYKPSDLSFKDMMNSFDKIIEQEDLIKY